jgi:preprotein translocase subunit SecG
VRTTIIIGGIFFATSLALTSIANRSNDGASGIEKALESTLPATVPEGPVDLFDPSVPLLGNEPAPAAPTSVPVETAPAPAQAPTGAVTPPAATPAPEAVTQPAPADPIPQ